jgi:DNA-binding transcriptional ArsR family regulator
VTAPRVDLAAGDGYDLLISAVAVADPDWCSVLSHGAEVRDVVRRSGGAALSRDAARFGRFGWINLCGLLARRRASTRDQLLDTLTALPPAELHVVLVGGLRRQLADRVTADRLHQAVAGDAAAWRDVRRTLATPGMLLDVSPWLQRSPSRQVREVLLRTVEAWPQVGDVRASRAGLARARAVRRDEGPEAVLRMVTAGIQYGPSVLDRVLLVSSRLVEPILIWVDQPGLTVIVHPPLDETGINDAGSVLTVLGAAVGDETRMQLLRELRSGPRTLVELCATLDRPRTTLLHHLALLRSAGLVGLTVASGEPNVYRLDARGFDQLARAAKGFVLG